MKKATILTLILLIFFTGCSNLKSKSSNRSLDNSEKEQGPSQNQSLKQTVKTYLDYLEKGIVKRELLISKRYTFLTDDEEKLLVWPVKDNPFAHLKVKKMKDNQVKSLKPKTTIHYFTVTADIKWPGQEKLYKNAVFFLTAIREKGQWKLDGAHTEF